MYSQSQSKLKIKNLIREGFKKSNNEVNFPLPEGDQKRAFSTFLKFFGHRILFFTLKFFMYRGVVLLWDISSTPRSKDIN